jgi:hypothetical protein
VVVLETEENQEEVKQCDRPPWYNRNLPSAKQHGYLALVSSRKSPILSLSLMYQALMIADLKVNFLAVLGASVWV